MSVWAIIPAKDLHRAKIRLAPVLPPDQRQALVRRLLDRTVSATLACPALAGTLVVSADASLRELALRRGAQVCPDPEGGTGVGDPLNHAIAHGRDLAVALGAGAALVLPADLPLLSPETIVAFLDAAGDAAVAIAPDRAGTGTNTLLLRPPQALTPLFGPSSYQRHQDAARSRGLSVATVPLPALALDLDTPADLARLRDEGSPGDYILETIHGR